MKKDLLQSYFESLEDPRSHINQLHSLNNILVIGVVSVICGAETWKQMEEFAEAKQEFLSTILDLSNDVPSDDTFNRVFSAIDTKQFEACFADWATSLSEEFKQQVIAIDGTSLTVVNSGTNTFSVAIIPYTLENTLFKTYKVGTKVNLEFDVIGKYVTKLMEVRLK